MRVGMKVFLYTFTLADAILILIFIRYALIKFNQFQLDSIPRRLIGFYLIFLTTLFISFLGIKDLKAGLVEMIAFLYNLGVVALFSLYLTERKGFGIQILFYSFFISLISMILGSFLVLSHLDIKDIILFNHVKYIFFLKFPNQMALWCIICFCAYILGKEYLENKKGWLGIFNFIIPALFFLAITMSGSRLGALVAFVLVIFSLYLEIKKLRWVYRIVYIVIPVLLFSFFVVFINRQQNVQTEIFYRALRIFKDAGKGSFIGGDVREQNFKDALTAFQTKPVNGVGLGNAWKYYSQWEIHSTLLSVLAETGIIGIMGFLLLMGYPYYYILRYDRKIKYFILYSSLILFSMGHYILRQRWFWLFIVYLLYYMVLEKKKEKPVRSLPEEDG